VLDSIAKLGIFRAENALEATDSDPRLSVVQNFIFQLELLMYKLQHSVQNFIFKLPDGKLPKPTDLRLA
jgi:hypothetical protein